MPGFEEIYFSTFGRWAYARGHCIENPNVQNWYMALFETSWLILSISKIKLNLPNCWWFFPVYDSMWLEGDELVHVFVFFHVMANIFNFNMASQNNFLSFCFRLPWVLWAFWWRDTHRDDQSVQLCTMGVVGVRNGACTLYMGYYTPRVQSVSGGCFFGKFRGAW